MPVPTLHTDRLLLRPFGMADARDVQRLAGEREIAATTIRIPHPYPDGAAEAWIGTHEERFERGIGAQWATTLAGEGALLGAVGLDIDAEHDHAELGYWIARPEWGKGYATEAARAAVDWGFGTRGLQRIHAHHFAGNPASGRVLEKVGMTHEGTLRRHVKEWGELVDIEIYGALAGES